MQPADRKVGLIGGSTMEDEVLGNDAHSDWLRAALKSALECDPIRVANDAELLAFILRQRAQKDLVEPMSDRAGGSVAATDSIELTFPDALPAMA